MNIFDEDLAVDFMKSVPKAMWAIRFELRKHAEDEFTVPQFRILTHIQSKKALTIGALANLHGVNITSMSRMIDTLVSKGFVIKEKNEEDKRQVSLTLSKNGEKKFLQIKKEASKAFTKTFEKLTNKEKEALKITLEVIQKLYSSETIDK